MRARSSKVQDATLMVEAALRGLSVGRISDA